MPWSGDLNVRPSNLTRCLSGKLLGGSPVFDDFHAESQWRLLALLRFEHAVLKSLR
ncbi:hypothetical protein XF_0807 [Xylella fastidiosa 9a5c]|uniref:Uncharacterized protein n=1 Tax=Xylella fastidiosa (strain 9a5c) TaxID=160492 RepID=Q9PF71_XYLFA|nr:hypothetical protein XF_0807 [Xylella fastidiosa 9a5c]